MPDYSDLSTYVVVYGAAMVLLGAKDETNDVDIQLLQHGVFTSLIKNGYIAEPGPEDMKNMKVTLTDKTDAFIGPMKVDLRYYTIQEGFQVQTLSNILAEKKARGREKDKADIEMLTKLLEV